MLRISIYQLASDLLRFVYMGVTYPLTNEPVWEFRFMEPPVDSELFSRNLLRSSCYSPSTTQAAMLALEGIFTARLSRRNKFKCCFLNCSVGLPLLLVLPMPLTLYGAKDVFSVSVKR